MLRAVPARLYVVPASHPCAAAARALELKGVAFTTVNLLPVFHKLHQKVRFGGAGTVPGLVFEDGTKVLGSTAIIDALEERHREPRLRSGDVREREAEDWGEQALQPIGRRLIWQGLSRAPQAQLSYTEGVKLVPPAPAPVARMSAGALAWAERRIHASTEPAARADLTNLPRHLDRIDGWLEDGVIGGDQANAADLQIASGLRILLTMGDLAPLIDAHAAGAYARRVFPDYPGHTPAGTLPAGWLPTA